MPHSPAQLKRLPQPYMAPPPSAAAVADCVAPPSATAGVMLQPADWGAATASWLGCGYSHLAAAQLIRAMGRQGQAPPQRPQRSSEVGAGGQHEHRFPSPGTRRGGGASRQAQELENVHYYYYYYY